MNIEQPSTNVIVQPSKVSFTLLNDPLMLHLPSDSTTTNFKHLQLFDIHYPKQIARSNYETEI